MLWLRAVIAFLALPAMVAGLIPLLLVRADRFRAPGVVWLPGALLAIGLPVLLWCVWEFFARGKGTLAPWDAPKHLVVSGLYRYTRNPMYVGVLLIVGGWAAFSASPLLAIYAVVLALGFHLRVRLYEEPVLRKQFGREFEDYCAAVPRWLARSRRRQ
jgi:protein-S-isoprenylcysteine O-methyltransferase Ste14